MAAVVALVVVDPFGGLRSAPDWAGWISGQQRLDRVMSRVAPVLFISTGVSAAGAAVVAAQRHATTVAIWRGLAAAFVAAAVGVTLKVNEPLNERLRGWRAEGVPPADWRAVRSRWEKGHRARRALLAIAAGAAVLGRPGAAQFLPRKRGW